MNRSLKYTLICATLLILFCIPFYIWWHIKNPPIQTIEAKFSYPYQTTGIVQSDYYYLIRYQPKYGQIQDIHVKDGQSISKESSVLTYYNPLIIPEINALSSITKQFSNTQQAFTGLRELVKLKSQLYTTIQSPIQGIVRLHEIVPSKKDSIILEIQSKTQSIILNLPEEIYTKLAHNHTVKLEHIGTHQIVKGHITAMLEPSNTSISDKQNLYYHAYIKIDKHYPIGSKFTVYLGTPKMIFPSDILLHKNYVVIHKNGKYVKRIINYDRMNKQLIIKSGIFACEKIV